jgi:hypothetical protein
MATTTKKKAASKVVCLVTLASLSGSTENEKLFGLSFRPEDDQDLWMEVGLDESMVKKYDLKVDRVYEATFHKKGSVKDGIEFKIGHLKEVDNGSHYDEKLVVKGSDPKKFFGDISLNVKPDQEQFFWEDKEYVLQFAEVKE